MFNINTWIEWLKFCGVERYSSYMYRKNPEFIVSSTIDLIEQQKELYENPDTNNDLITRKKKDTTN